MADKKEEFRRKALSDGVEADQPTFLFFYSHLLTLLSFSRLLYPSINTDCILHHVLKTVPPRSSEFPFDSTDFFFFSPLFKSRAVSKPQQQLLLSLLYRFHTFPRANNILFPITVLNSFVHLISGFRRVLSLS